MLYQWVLIYNKAEVKWIVDSKAIYVRVMYAMITELQSLEKLLDIAFRNGRTLEATGHGTEILILESGFLRRKCL